MKNKLIITIVALGFLFTGSAFAADTEQLKSYYNDCITAKINCCMSLSHIYDKCPCVNCCMRDFTKMRALQAEFYGKHRGELIDALIANAAGKNSGKIDYILINNFKTWHHAHLNN